MILSWEEYTMEKKLYYSKCYGNEEMEEVISEEIEILSYNVKRLRKEKNFSQKELAEKANISLSTVIKIENGTHKNVTYNQIRRIAFAFDEPISQVIEVDFYVEKMKPLNRFLLYYPLLKQSDLIDIFGAVMFVNSTDSARYLENRLERLYERFPLKIKAFLDLEYLSNYIGDVYTIIREGRIPEPYDDILTINEYHKIENNYNMLVKLKREQSIITDAVSYLENGSKAIIYI